MSISFYDKFKKFLWERNTIWVKKFPLMYNTQRVPAVGYNLTIPITLESGPSLRYISTLSNPIDERTW